MAHHASSECDKAQDHIIFNVGTSQQFHSARAPIPYGLRWHLMMWICAQAQHHIIFMIISFQHQHLTFANMPGCNIASFISHMRKHMSVPISHEHTFHKSVSCSCWVEVQRMRAYENPTPFSHATLLLLAKLYFLVYPESSPSSDVWSRFCCPQGCNH